MEVDFDDDLLADEPGPVSNDFGDWEEPPASVAPVTTLKNPACMAADTILQTLFGYRICADIDWSCVKKNENSVLVFVNAGPHIDTCKDTGAKDFIKLSNFRKTRMTVELKHSKTRKCQCTHASAVTAEKEMFNKVKALFFEDDYSAHLTKKRKIAEVEDTTTSRMSNLPPACGPLLAKPLPINQKNVLKNTGLDVEVRPVTFTSDTIEQELFVTLFDQLHPELAWRTAAKPVIMSSSPKNKYALIVESDGFIDNADNYTAGWGRAKHITAFPGVFDFPLFLGEILHVKADMVQLLDSIAWKNVFDALVIERHGDKRDFVMSVFIDGVGEAVDAVNGPAIVKDDLDHGIILPLEKALESLNKNSHMLCGFVQNYWEDVVENLGGKRFVYEAVHVAHKSHIISCMSGVVQRLVFSVLETVRNSLDHSRVVFPIALVPGTMVYRNMKHITTEDMRAFVRKCSHQLFGVQFPFLVGDTAHDTYWPVPRFVHNGIGYMTDTSLFAHPAIQVGQNIRPMCQLYQYALQFQDNPVSFSQMWSRTTLNRKYTFSSWDNVVTEAIAFLRKSIVFMGGGQQFMVKEDMETDASTEIYGGHVFNRNTTGFVMKSASEMKILLSADKHRLVVARGSVIWSYLSGRIGPTELIRKYQQAARLDNLPHETAEDLIPLMDSVPSISKQKVTWHPAPSAVLSYYDLLINRFSMQILPDSDEIFQYQEKVDELWLPSLRMHHFTMFNTFCNVPYPPSRRALITDKGCFNMFASFACRPLVGTENAEFGYLADRFVSHMYKVVCNSNTHDFVHLISSMYYMVQFPNESMQTFLTVCGQQGTGKSIYLDGLAAMVGPALTAWVSTVSRLTGRFNGFLLGKRLVCVSEANESRMTADELSAIKDLTTGNRVAIEEKYKPLASGVVNRVYITMTSNNRGQDLALNENGDARRAAIHEVSSVHQRDQAYFLELVTDIKHDMFPHALYTWLLNHVIPPGGQIPPGCYPLVEPWDPKAMPTSWLKHADSTTSENMKHVIDQISNGNLLKKQKLGDPPRYAISELVTPVNANGKTYTAVKRDDVLDLFAALYPDDNKKSAMNWLCRQNMPTMESLKKTHTCKAMIDARGRMSHSQHRFKVVLIELCANVAHPPLQLPDIV